MTLKVGSLSAVIATVLGVPAAFALVRHVIPAKVAGERTHPLRAGDAADRDGAVDLPVLRPARLRQLRLRARLRPGRQRHALRRHQHRREPAQRRLNLERAAIIHGAHPLWAILRITLPIIAPGIVIGAIFAFVHSAHELLIAMFVLGGVGKPVAVKIWSDVQATSDPTIAAASAHADRGCGSHLCQRSATQALTKRRTAWSARCRGA